MLGLWLLLAAGLRRWLALARGSLGFVDTTARAELYTWIRQHSPQTAVVVKPPSGFEDLALHTGRAGFVQFKQVPTAYRSLSPQSLRSLVEQAQATLVISANPQRGPKGREAAPRTGLRRPGWRALAC